MMGPDSPGRPTPVDEAVRRLIASVAHGVGNSLSAIRTYVELVAQRLEHTELGGRCIERIATDSHRIERVIETLSRLGSLPAPARRPVDVSALIAGLLRNERPATALRHVAVHEHFDGVRPIALGDAEQLAFAFESLLGEVLAWTPDRGDLHVATAHRERSGRVRSTVCITIRFPGTPAAVVSFAENALGVVTAEAVVLAHGGSFAVGARDGCGEIIVELPTRLRGLVSEGQPLPGVVSARTLRGQRSIA